MRDATRKILGLDPRHAHAPMSDERNAAIAAAQDRITAVYDSLRTGAGKTPGPEARTPQRVQETAARAPRAGRAATPRTTKTDDSYPAGWNRAKSDHSRETYPFGVKASSTEREGAAYPSNWTRQPRQPRRS